ncbi:MAG: bifunctional nicotinamidase/pyrazinamidase [Deltaproteobacteria bacterium]|nr:bifunctional nicotinamidase/pyrazinamidase [Deltaproteobacteria bacterium]
MERDAALLIVDLQNDFCPGGALPVPEGDLVVEPLNRAAQCFAAAGLPVVASRDWHPPVTRHFREYGGLWPPHCVQGSEGAAFHPALRLPEGSVVISKGSDPERDSYSAFEAATVEGRSLEEFLTSKGVRHLYVGGLATDYCVRSSVLDALRAGFAVTVLTDAVAGVEVAPGDSAKALEEMRQTGAQFGTVNELVTTQQA